MTRLQNTQDGNEDLDINKRLEPVHIGYAQNMCLTTVLKRKEGRDTALTRYA